MLILDWDAYLKNFYKLQMVGYVSKDPVGMFMNLQTVKVQESIFSKEKKLVVGASSK